MKSVKVSTKKLLETVQANRESHNKEYIEALKIWKDEVIAQLQKNLDNARQGGDLITSINNLPKPTSYIADYDRLISMLNWTEEESIELDAQEFDQYVNDNWQWQRAFKSVNSAYLVK